MKTLVRKTQIVQVSQCRLRLGRNVRQGEATAIRGFFGRKFEDEIWMHNHQADGTPVYQYPRVQYKVVNQTALLIGVNEGSELMQRLWLEIDETKIGSEELPVLESSFETNSHEILPTTEPIEYRFITPWLALNQKNFAEYTRSRSQKFRRDKLEKTIVGNCLGMCKSLGIFFQPDPDSGEKPFITADCRNLTSIKTTLKGKGMIGFVGKFKINLSLPDHIGLGKSVSRGFGTIDRFVP